MSQADHADRPSNGRGSTGEGGTVWSITCSWNKPQKQAEQGQEGAA